MLTINTTSCQNPLVVNPRKRKKVYSVAKRTGVFFDDYWYDGKAWHPRKETRVECDKRRPPRGFQFKRYLVGCGHCDTCKSERVEAKQRKWQYRLTNMVGHFNRWGVVTFNRGKEKYHEPGKVYFLTLTVRNSKYPGASWTRKLTDKQIAKLNRDPRFRNRSYREMKKMFQSFHHNQRRFKDTKYVVFPEWGSRNTKRIHFHAFFFVSGTESKYIKDFLETWQEVSDTTQGDWKPITEGDVAAAYATKYATKSTHKYRVMSSQFNWANYEVKFRLDDLGLTTHVGKGRTPAGYDKRVYYGGTRHWHVIEETVPVSVIREAKDPLVGLQKYRDGLYVRGRLETDKPTTHPFKGGFVRCEEKEDSTLKQRIASTRWSRPGCYLRLLPQAKELSRQKHFQAVMQRTNLALLPTRITEVVFDLLDVLGFGPALLSRVLKAISSSLARQLMASTDHHQSLYPELS